MDLRPPPSEPRDYVPRAPLVWQLVLAPIAIVVFFVASTMYTQHIAARIDEDAAGITTNALPSVTELSVARGDVFHAEAAVARAVEAAPGTVEREHLAAEQALAELRAHQASYLSLPFYPNERDHWKEVDAATHAFDQAVTKCFAALEAGRTNDAAMLLKGELRPATDRLDKGLQVLVQFNAEQEKRIAADIAALRSHTARMAYTLTAASALLAAVLILLTVMDVRRRQQLVAAFSRRLEDIAGATVRIGAALSARQQDAVLQSIVDEAARLVDAPFSALGFVVAEDQSFNSFVFHGMSRAQLEKIGRSPRPVGVLGEVVAQNRTVRIDDVTKHPSFRGMPDGHPAVGPFLGVPIRRNRNGNGQLYLARRPKAPPFSEQDVHIIELLALQAAVASENARLYHELDQQRERAQLLSDISSRMVATLDYQATLDHVANAPLPMCADICAIHVIGEDGVIQRVATAAADPAWRLFLAELDVLGSRPPDSHPALRAVRERRPLRFDTDDVTLDRMSAEASFRRRLAQIPMKHGVSIPIIGRTRLLGAITFVTFREAPFSDGDVAFLEELARRTALAIDNAILYERTCRAVQARNDMIAFVSHDLKNPISALRMTADLMRQHIPHDAHKLHEIADRITRRTDLMMRLISDLLDASKMESGTFRVDMKPEPLEPLIGETIELLHEQADAKSIALRSDISDAVSYVNCDRDRIRQVLWNLVGNAVKFTPADGRVIVEARRAGEEVRISVSDTGPGIPEDERQRVFDRYWQATLSRRAGAGLGLFIVKGIIDAHGGRAWVESAPGGGACLCFTLPAAAALREQPHHAPHP